MSGDLNLNIRLGSFQVDGVPMEVWLSHRCLVMDYDDTKSSFDLRPFQTAIFDHGANNVLWISPGGRDVIFNLAASSRTLTASEREDLEKKLNRYLDVGATVCEADDIKLIQLGEKRLIIDEGWLLIYNRGLPEIFVSPSGSILKVAGRGSFVNRIVCDGSVLVSLDRNSRNLPDSIEMANARWKFDYGEGGELRRISSAAIEMEFSYYSNGLLKQYTRNGVAIDSYAWQTIANFTRGDVQNVLPFALRSTLSSRYRYAIKNGNVDLEQSTSSETTRHIRIRLLNHKIQWVSEE